VKFVEEEPAMPGTDELRNLENWVNVPRSILKSGRATPLTAPPGMTEEEATEFLEKQA
jgi:hypothetical protein